MNHSLFSSTFSFYSLFLLKITTRFHCATHRTALVVALAGSVFSGKHRLGASLIFRELEVVVDAHIQSYILHIKIIGTDDLDVENIALDMGIDNHLQFSEDEAGTKAMFARENRARERYNKCRAMGCAMEAGSYFEEK